MTKTYSLGEIVHLVGGAPAMAARLGVSRQTVYFWLAQDRIPGNRAAQICEEFRLNPNLVLPLTAPPKRYRKRRAEQRTANVTRA